MSKPKLTELSTYKKVVGFSWNEWQRISEALGILVADQTEGRRGYYRDKELMKKWDSLEAPLLITQTCYRSSKARNRT